MCEKHVEELHTLYANKNNLSLHNCLSLKKLINLASIWIVWYEFIGEKDIWMNNYYSL